MDYEIPKTIKNNYVESWQKLTINEIRLLDSLFTQQELLVDKLISNGENLSKDIEKAVRNLSGQELVNYQYNYFQLDHSSLNIDFIYNQYYPQLIRSSALISTISLLEKSLLNLFKYYEISFKKSRQIKNGQFVFENSKKLNFFKHVKIYTKNIAQYQNTSKNKIFKEMISLSFLRNKIVHNFCSIPVLSGSKGTNKKDVLRDEKDRTLLDFIKENEFLNIEGNKRIEPFDEGLNLNNLIENERLILFDERFISLGVVEKAIEFVNAVADSFQVAIGLNNYQSKN